ncbi:hypothetical protein CSUB01_11734 [Colletotrichum sublineola]|uniref:Aminoglycoside phosphotransferase domain-containing protein n=1 Tax=Colletotrichum sublineola TaxID=1173701 RepID=A0A066Y1P0_COLSU|nr:hypothetical protein CSUB01_11734 [Colletotrichum sublineola]
MAVQGPVNNSIQEIDSQTWLVGGRLLLSRSLAASPGCLWSDGCDSFYSISEVTEAPPVLQPLSTPSLALIRLIYDAGDSSAVWAIGNAFLKVKIADQPRTTREHVTLAGMKAMKLSFSIPDVLYHGEWAGRQYLVLSKVPGLTLADAWPMMDETKKRHYVERVVSVCKELGKLQADRISGLDGNQLLDPLLVKRDAEKDFSHENLVKGCMELHMDCSTFIFSHCDLGPGNIIMDGDGSLGIIDWEMAGFVPKDWIRTRFCVSGGLDLPGEGDERVDWRRRMQRRLASEGYPEVADGWMSWWRGG